MWGTHLIVSYSKLYRPLFTKSLLVVYSEPITCGFMPFSSVFICFWPILPPLKMESSLAVSTPPLSSEVQLCGLLLGHGWVRNSFKGPLIHPPGTPTIRNRLLGRQELRGSVSGVQGSPPTLLPPS